MSSTRIPRWISFFLLGVGVLVLAVPSLLVYVRLTATRVNADPERISSVTNFPPPQKWAAAVERGRGFVRTTLSEENLPGMSVAVGVDGEIVWAEGFGFANLENSVPVAPEHRFRIGTASIPLTSAGIGVLLDERRLKLDDAVQAYVPEFGGVEDDSGRRSTRSHRRPRGHRLGPNVRVVADAARARDRRGRVIEHLIAWGHVFCGGEDRAGVRGSVRALVASRRVMGSASNRCTPCGTNERQMNWGYCGVALASVSARSRIASRPLRRSATVRGTSTSGSMPIPSNGRPSGKR